MKPARSAWNFTPTSTEPSALKGSEGVALLKMLNGPLPAVVKDQLVEPVIVLPEMSFAPLTVIV